MPDALTTRDVAKILNTYPRRVQRLVERQELTPLQRIPAGRNGAYLFDPAEVNAYVARIRSAA